MVRRPAKKVLREVYDSAFEKTASQRESWPGDAHDAGLRAVYDKGLVDGATTTERERGNGKQ